MVKSMTSGLWDWFQFIY